MDTQPDAHGPHRRSRLLPLALLPAPAEALSPELPEALLYYLPGWLEPGLASVLLEVLPDRLAWQTHTLKIFGRTVRAPRLSAWHGDPGAVYAYSGLALEPAPWTAELSALRDALQGVTGIRFNSVLGNLYRDGRDYMGWHADNEAALGPEPVIASVSLGAPRRFLLRHRRRPELPTHELWLEPGSLLVMAGTTQQHWKHALAPMRRLAAPRINLTFRTVRGADGR